MRKTLLIMFIFLFAFTGIATAAVSDTIIKEIIIDKTAPLAPTLDGVSENWVNTDVVVTVKDIVDPVNNGVSAGIKEVNYAVNGTETTKTGDSNFTINLTSEGIYTISGKATDNVGNIGAEAIGEVKIDKTSPIINITGAETGKVYYNPVIPTFSASDEKAGLNTCTATIKKDAGAETPFVSGTTVSEQGNYTLKVTATDNAGNESNETLSFSINAPIAPTITSNAINPNSIKIEWNAIEGAIGYKVLDGASELANITETSYTHTGLTPNSEHNYTVVAYNLIGDSPVSDKKKVYTLANKPANPQITAKTSNTLTVTWEGDNPEGTEYSVSIIDGETVSFTADMKEHTFTGLSLANVYTIAVKARNFDNVETEEITLEASTNKAPVLTLTTPTEGSAFSLIEGHNTIVVKGSVADDDNDDVTVTATINGNSKSVAVDKCKDGKPFEIIFNASEFTEGAYTVTVVADDNK